MCLELLKVCDRGIIDHYRRCCQGYCIHVLHKMRYWEIHLHLRDHKGRRKHVKVYDVNLIVLTSKANQQMKTLIRRHGGTGRCVSDTPCQGRCGRRLRRAVGTSQRVFQWNVASCSCPRPCHFFVDTCILCHCP